MEHPQFAIIAKLSELLRIIGNDCDKFNSSKRNLHILLTQLIAYTKQTYNLSSEHKTTKQLQHEWYLKNKEAHKHKALQRYYTMRQSTPPHPSA